MTIQLAKNAIHLACLRGHLDIVKHLKARSADISMEDKDGDHCLHYAAIGKQPKVMEHLIQMGADVNAINSKKCSPLHYAVNVKCKDSVEVLLKHNADTNLQDQEGDTVLHDIIKSPQARHLLHMVMGIKHTDPSVTNQTGFNCLHLAAMKGNCEAVSLILRSNPELINVQKKDGFTPLHLASLNGHLEVVKLLRAQKNISVDECDATGRSALHHASMRGFYKILEALLHNGDGSNVNLKDREGNTPLHLALSDNAETDTDLQLSSVQVDAAILNQILQAGVAEHLQQRTAIALLLIINGSDLMAKNGEGVSCLDLVRDANVRKLLIEKSQQIMCNYKANYKIQNTFTTTRDLKSKCTTSLQAVRRSTPTMYVNKAQMGNHQVNSDRVKDLEAKLKEFEDQYICFICMDRKKNVVFPCGHSACSECVDTLRCCHMCRGQIDEKIVIY